MTEQPHKQRPKLLVVADTYHPKVDGTLKFIDEFLKRASADFEISLLVPDFDGKNKREKDVTFIKVSRLFHLSEYNSMRLSFSNLRKIRRAVKEADCVFVQGPAMISYLSVLYAHRYKKKVVFYTHVLSWEVFAKFVPSYLRWLFHILLKKLSLYVFNRCDEILVPYHTLRDELQKEGVKATMHIAKLGVDIDLFNQTNKKLYYKQKFGLDPERTVIGYVGRISREKNVQVLIDAFRKLENQERLTLLLVGNGPEELKKELDLPKNCKVTGFVTNVHDYLKAMDIFVMPSLTETTSLATLEAMSTGLPVVVTKVGFIQDYVVKDHTGIFFPKNSATMLSIQLKKLWDDPVLRAKLGENARKTVAYSFSWERSVNRIRRLLLKLIYS